MVTKTKRSVDKKDMGGSSRRATAANPLVAVQAGQSGINENVFETGPLYREAGYETIIGQDVINNCRIIFGKDRKTHKASGYSTDQKAGAIDIVVGLNGPSKAIDQTANEVNKNFNLDAARVYISRKCDPDAYINCKTGRMAKAASAAIMKADEVRIVGRGDVKIVTGHDSKNSSGFPISTIGNIDLIGGAGRLEPLVKGDQLVEFLRQMLKAMKQSVDVFNKYVDIELEIYRLVAQHVHHSPFFGELTVESLEHILGMPAYTLQISTEIVLKLELLLGSLNTLEGNWLEQDKPFLSKKVRTT